MCGSLTLQSDPLFWCGLNVASHRVGHQDSGLSVGATQTLFSRTSGGIVGPKLLERSKLMSAHSIEF